MWGWGRGEAGSPEESFVVGGAAAVEEFEVFFLEGAVPVVFVLSGDVFFEGVAARRANGEGSVAFLPCEGGVTDVVMDPTGGDGLDIAYGVCEARGGAQADEEVDVIGDAADGLRDAVEVAHHAAEEGVEAVTPCRGDERCAVFGAEHDVVVEGEVGGWHGGGGVAAPAGAVINVDVRPVADATG